MDSRERRSRPGLSQMAIHSGGRISAPAFLLLVAFASPLTADESGDEECDPFFDVYTKPDQDGSEVQGDHIPARGRDQEEQKGNHTRDQ